jgi:hypothetical protein
MFFKFESLDAFGTIGCIGFQTPTPPEQLIQVEARIAAAAVQSSLP